MDERGVIAVNVRLAASDLYRFGVGELLRKFWWFLALIGLSGAGYIATSAKQPFTFDAVGVVRVLAFPILLCYAFFVAPYFSARKNLGTIAALQGITRYVFAPEGIDVHSPVAQAHIDWAAFMAAREMRTSFMLYPQKTLAHLLPKRCFSSEADVAELRALLREHVKGKVKLRG